MNLNIVKRLADGIYNDIVSGIRGYHNNASISMEQLQLEVVDMRLLIIKEYMLKGILPIQDLLVSINCIPVDCKSLDNCGCNEETCGSKPVAHFLIPLLLFDYGLNRAIFYLGSTDKSTSFVVYTSPLSITNTILKYRKRGKNKPFVFLDTTPNSDGFIDGYIFNAPLLKQISITAIFKDLRQLENFECCTEDNYIDSNFNFIDTLVKDRLTLLKLRYYRLFQAPIKPNDLTYGEA